MNVPGPNVDSPAAALANSQALSRKNLLARDWHRQVLTTSIVIIVLAMVLQVRSDQRVFVSGVAAVPVPETCGMQIMFGRPCPGCGLTRSFIHLAHGDWRSSLAIHRIGWLIALLVVCQIPYRLLALWRPELTVAPLWVWIIGAIVVIALSVNWIYNLVQEFSRL
ncbi:MAG: hypothetical protein JWP89_6331 [Schlesneria sp.]|nr:hypothetical protein [Schlesneria sp.]